MMRSKPQPGLAVGAANLSPTAKAHWYWKLMRLHDAANERTMLRAACVGMLEKRSKVVASPLLKSFLRSYQNTKRGQTMIVCAPSKMGKTVGATYLLYGDHGLRPRRALMVHADKWDDFPSDFGEFMGFTREESEYMPEALIAALTSSSDKKMGLTTYKKIKEVILRLRCWAASDLDNGDVRLVGELDRPPAGTKHPSSERPVLIIDGFNQDTPENRAFVSRLYSLAFFSNVVVYILTRNKEFASALVKLKRGSKMGRLWGTTSPTDELANSDDHYWMDSAWPVELLQDLVHLEFPNLSASLVEQVIDTTMSPAKALDLGGAEVMTRYFKGIFSEDEDEEDECYNDDGSEDTRTTTSDESTVRM